jgi:CheY-like chemotaxis protein
MNRQLDSMVRLIDDLLDVSRISRGTLDIRRERSELGSVIEHAMETAGPCFARRNQSIAFEPEGPVVALVDATRISQIVANLLNNASRHSLRGARVRVCLRREGNMALVRVVDQGAGIPSDQLARVFDMFTKIERPVQGTNEGIGIGLALSRRLAELHGGTLTAESAGEGKGATFTLAVPSGVPDPAVEHTPQTQAEEPTATPCARPGLSVVVVEDNEDAADMMSVWLEQFGHDVRIARTGPEGVALILEAHPDVVLCDLGLPGMDGVDVCRHVVHGMPAPPVMVALTGWGMEEDRSRTEEAGFRHHLVKPVEPETLRTVLESIGA